MCSTISFASRSKSIADAPSQANVSVCAIWTRIRAYFTLVIFHKFTSGTFTRIIIRRFLDLLREISRANFFPMASSDFHLPRILKTFFDEIEHTFFRFEPWNAPFMDSQILDFLNSNRIFRMFFSEALKDAKLKETPKTAIFGIEVFNI